MPADTAVTVAQQYYARRRFIRGVAGYALGLLLLVGALVVIAGLAALWRLTDDRTPAYADIVEHFKYGSIGSEPGSGLPLALWNALPFLFPEAFDGRADYSAFGFLYETDGNGNPRDLPVGISRRRVSGVEVVWFNCAVCHTGTVRMEADSAPAIVAGMPANNLDLHRFIDFLLSSAASDRLAPDRVFQAMEHAGSDLGPVDRLFWRLAVLPRVREELIARRAALGPLIAGQPAWGPGRVDTFNPYKVIQFDLAWDQLDEAERIGVADFPSIFLQGPRDGMFLHWDGNNPSLAERNLSAAIGAGVTPDTVDHAAIERVAAWLGDLEPTFRPTPAGDSRVGEGRALYRSACADCHGFRDETGYRFEGDRIGTVMPIDAIGTDPARLDSYTAEFAALQGTLFEGYGDHQFTEFRKTDGYANLPLDNLWLRAPYLHNGSVPTLAALLDPAVQRPIAFVRGLDILDIEQGGFIAPACNPGEPSETGICFDTRQPGNGNGGHEYGTDFTDAEKAALIAYMMTF